MLEQDHSIKDSCSKCGGTDDLDGVISPFPSESGGLDTATLCAKCRVEFEVFCEQYKQELEDMNTPCEPKQ